MKKSKQGNDILSTRQIAKQKDEKTHAVIYLQTYSVYTRVGHTETEFYNK